MFYIYRMTKLFSIIIISCLGAVVYSNTFHCSFHLDDFSYIVNNFAIKNIHNLQNIWNWWPCRFITFFTFALNYHFDHLNVFSYHLFNLAVHLVSAILVWWLVNLTLSTPVMKDEGISRHAGLISLFAGLVFVSHPVQTQAVTFIWQRAASMAALFYLASLCLYVKSRLPRQSRGLTGFYYIGSLVTAIAAMFTKENTITLPLMIVLYEFSFLKAKKAINWKHLIPFLLIFLLIPATWLLSGAEKFQARHSFVANISPLQYLLTEFRVIATYIRLLFLPLHQNLDYDYSLSKSIFEAPVLFSFIFLAAILFWAQRIFSKYRLVSFTVFWFFLTLLPESSFFPFADVIEEHRLYLPMAGYSVFLAGAAYYLFGKNNIKSMVIILSLIVAFNSFLTCQRNKIWRDDLTLWNDTVHRSPHKARAYGNRGMEYFKEGALAKAMADLNKAIEINPNYVKAYNNRGLVYFKQGDLDQAIADYSKAIEIDPRLAEAYSNRGLAYYDQGKFTQAIADDDKAIEINPNIAEVYYNRALVYKKYE